MAVNPYFLELQLVELTNGGTNLYFNKSYKKVWGTKIPGSSVRAQQRTFKKLHFPFQYDWEHIIENLLKLPVECDAELALDNYAITQTKAHQTRSYILGIGDQVQPRKSSAKPLHTFKEIASL